MEEYVANLIQLVAKGNPGAMRVIKELMYFTGWYKMMLWCDRNSLTGSSLWVKYKDEFHEDFMRLGEWIREQMNAEKDKSINLKVSVF